MLRRNQDWIITAMKLLAWIIFIGLCIDTGALLFNFTLTFYNPVATHDIYKGLNLSSLYEKQFIHYILLMSCIVVLSIMKAYLFFLVVTIFLKLNFVKPFSIEIAKLIEKVGFEAFYIAIFGTIANEYTKNLIQHGYDVDQTEKYWSDVGAFLMMAVIVYIISLIFKKGIELQKENDLTI